MLFLGSKTLESERLILRKYQKGDEVDIFDYAKEDEVTLFLTWPTHQSIETSKKILNIWLEEYNNKETFRWAIIFKKDNKLIGGIDSVHLFKDENDNYTIELGYVLNKKYWNKGIMSETLSLVRDYLFNECKASKILIRCNEQNIASYKVMLKAGFIDKGIRNESLIKGKNVKLIYTELTYEEYLNLINK